MYSQLLPFGHPVITHTSLLGTVSKSPVETAIKYISITLAITNSCYYQFTGTSNGPKQRFLLFYSCYKGHRVRAVTMKMINIYYKLWWNNFSQNNQGVIALILWHFSLFCLIFLHWRSIFREWSWNKNRVFGAECSQMPKVFHHSLIQDLGFFICFII